MPDILSMQDALPIKELGNIEAVDRKARKHLLGEKPYSGSLIAGNRLVSYFGNDVQGHLLQKVATITERTTADDGTEKIKTNCGVFTIPIEGAESSDVVENGLIGVAKKFYQSLAG